MSPLGANPLKRFLPNLAWKRESHFLTLTQNFIIVDLKIGLRAPEIAKIGNFWYKFAPKGQRGSLPILSIYNGKASPKDCKNYRGISLLSTPEKVFATVLLNKVRGQLLAHRRVKQSGYTSGRSMTDRIFTLNTIIQSRKEFQNPLSIAFVDLKAAFDLVDRMALWNCYAASAGIAKL